MKILPFHGLLTAVDKKLLYVLKPVVLKKVDWQQTFTWFFKDN